MLSDNTLGVRTFTGKVTVRLTEEEEAKLRDEAAVLFPRKADEEEGDLSKLVMLALEEHWKQRARQTAEARIGAEFIRFPARVRELLRQIGERIEAYRHEASTGRARSPRGKKQPRRIGDT